MAKTYDELVEMVYEKVTESYHSSTFLDKAYSQFFEAADDEKSDVDKTVSSITKLLGVSLLSIAAIKAASGIKKAGTGVMYMGKSQYKLANSRSTELKSRAKLSDAEAKKLRSDINDTDRRFALEVERQAKDGKTAEAIARLSEAEKERVYADMANSKKRLEADILDKEKRFKADMKRQKKEDKKAAARAKMYKAEAAKLEEEAKKIEQEVKDTIVQFNDGRITKAEMKRKLASLTAAARSLVERSKNAQKATEKDVKESVDLAEYESEIVSCVLEYVIDGTLESVDFTGVVDMITESFDI